MQALSTEGSPEIIRSKRIIVLANSWKLQGRCIAGREIVGYQKQDPRLGDWIRPIGPAENGELDPSDFRLSEQNEPTLLDIVDVPVGQRTNDILQPENWMIEKGVGWNLVGRLPQSKLASLTDYPEDLWDEVTGYTDCVSAEFIQQHPPKQSLYLIDVEHGVVVPAQKGRCRVQFEFRGRRYSLKVSDPVFSNRFNEAILGADSRTRIELKRFKICVSLGLEYYGCHYKLAASIFTDW